MGSGILTVQDCTDMYTNRLGYVVINAGKIYLHIRLRILIPSPKEIIFKKWLQESLPFARDV